MDDATRRHNAMAPDIVTRIVKGTNYSVEEALVVLESVVLGVISFHIHAFDPGAARFRAGSEYLDVLTERVVDRFKDTGRPST